MNKKELELLLNVSIFIDSVRPLLVVRSSSRDFFIIILDASRLAKLSIFHF